MKQLTLKQLSVNHAYYCSDSNYYSNDASVSYKIWDDFMDEFKDSDMDYNLCFRFDLLKDDDTDFYYAMIFMMQQRKGKFVPIHVGLITEEDVPSIVAWLTPRWEYMKKLWKPIS
jgi:hypothetical protein